MDLADLITRAADAAGDQNALAAALGVKAQRLSDWKHARVTCPLHAQARIAELAGIDAKEWVWEQVCRQMGRVAAAVLLTLAASLAAFGAHGVDGGWAAFKRRLKPRQCILCKISGMCHNAGLGRFLRPPG